MTPPAVNEGESVAAPEERGEQGGSVLRSGVSRDQPV